MRIKLRVGCWAVTRGGKIWKDTVPREIVNIINVKKCSCASDGAECEFDTYIATDGRRWPRTGKYTENEIHAFDIVRVFNTKRDAENWVEFPAQAGRFFKRIWPWAFAAAAIAAFAILTGCGVTIKNPLCLVACTTDDDGQINNNGRSR